MTWLLVRKVLLNVCSVDSAAHNIGGGAMLLQRRMHHAWHGHGMSIARAHSRHVRARATNAHSLERWVMESGGTVDGVQLAIDAKGSRSLQAVKVCNMHIMHAGNCMWLSHVSPLARHHV